MKVTEFFVGFGPRLWSVRRRETEYGVKALPLGGYCRIVGMTNLEEVDPADEDRTYRQRPVWRRLTVAVAGSCMHFLIAFAVLFAMFAGTGDVSGYLPVPADSPIVAIDGLAHGPSPAQQAGFRLGDRVEAVDGHHFATFAAMREFIVARPDTRLAVEVDRHGHLLTLHPRTVNLQQVEVRGVGAAATRVSKPTGFIGFEVSSVVHSSLGASVLNAAGDWWHIASATLGAFGRLLTLHGIQSYLHLLSSAKAAAHPGPRSVRFESPVGIVVLLHRAAGAGLAWVLYLLAAINLSLGIFNLVPLLPLDGGHVVIAVYEGIRGALSRRPYHADVRKLLPVFYLAIALIAFLGISSLFLDIRQLAT
jgi:membrane-associated protease RseP (regulator of RpoE activity)